LMLRHRNRKNLVIVVVKKFLKEQVNFGLFFFY